MYIFSPGAARAFVCAFVYVWERGREGGSKQRPVRVATTWIHKCSACGVRIVCVCICVLMCMLLNGWVGGCVCVYVSAATTWTHKCMYRYSAVYIYAFIYTQTYTYVHILDKCKHTRMCIILINVYTSIFMHMYTCLYVWTYIHMDTWTQVHVHRCPRMYTYICLYIYMHRFIHLCVCVCVWKYVNICVYIHVCTCLNVHVCIYTWMIIFMYVYIYHVHIYTQLDGQMHIMHKRIQKLTCIHHIHIQSMNTNREHHRAPALHAPRTPPLPLRATPQPTVCAT